MPEEQPTTKTYTVLTELAGFPIVSKCLCCTRPVLFSPKSFQDPGEACQEFEKAVRKENSTLVYEYVTPQKFFSSLIKKHPDMLLALIVL